LRKCIPKDYREGELNKGEAVCIDRCSAKFFDVQMKISEILQAEAAAKGSGGGGGLGFGGM
jgi:import inner membrane translocase subunit TIM10